MYIDLISSQGGELTSRHIVWGRVGEFTSGRRWNLKHKGPSIVGSGRVQSTRSYQTMFVVESQATLPLRQVSSLIPVILFSMIYHEEFMESSNNVF